MVKLTPNVTDMVSIARAVEDAGADSISAIKTVDHTVFSGNTSMTDFPLITHFPPNNPFLSLQTLHFHADLAAMASPASVGREPHEVNPQ